MKTVLEKLAEEYPQLYLNPDEDTQEAYREVVLRGGEPEKKSLVHYAGDANDRDEPADTPAGRARVVTLGNRRDFELIIRGLMAARFGPLAPVPESQGAAMLTVYNWPRIHAHMAAFPEEEQQEEFRRFTSVKANYIDQLVVLSRGPYSHIGAEQMGMDGEEWLAVSDTIRRYHELTHLICRRLYPDRIDKIRDELVADTVGLYAAFGRFDPELVRKFLGITDRRYTGGRLHIYAENPEEEAGPVCDELERIRETVEAHPAADPFALIPLLMEKQ